MNQLMPIYLSQLLHLCLHSSVLRLLSIRKMPVQTGMIKSSRLQVGISSHFSPWLMFWFAKLQSCHLTACHSSEVDLTSIVQSLAKLLLQSLKNAKASALFATLQTAVAHAPDPELQCSTISQYSLGSAPIYGRLFVSLDANICPHLYAKFLQSRTLISSV